jgi:CDGSH-type Zn-finger protein
MSQVTIKTRLDGPLLVTGPVKLTDHTGQTFDLTGQANIALCRCGGSQKRPFCDGSHKSNGYRAAELATPAQQQQQ